MNWIKTSAYVLSGTLAAVSGVVLAVVQGQGKADLASGYELDIIASAVVGGASLVGGRGSVAGAVLGALIFGVLRNALPQIPGATFYDRLIVGVVVIGIVVMDQVLDAKECWRRTMKRLMVLAAVVAMAAWACGGGSSPEARSELRFALIPKALDIPVFDYANVGAQREAAAQGDIDSHLSRTGPRRRTEAETDSRVVHPAEGRRHRDFGPGRRVPDEHDRQGRRCGDSGVTWDSDAPTSKRFAFYGVDDFRSGEMGERPQAPTARAPSRFMTSLGATRSCLARLDTAPKKERSRSIRTCNW